MSEVQQSPTLEGKIEVLSGFAFSSSGFNQIEGLPLIRIRDLGGSTTEVRFRGRYDQTYRVIRGDLLIGMDGDFEVHRWGGDDALLNQRVCKISTASRSIDQNFLYWYLKPEIAEIHRKTPQTTVRHLSTKDVYSINEPSIGVNEQIIVAEILDTIDTAICETEAIIAKLKAVKQGLLHDLLTRGIAANGELRPTQSEAPQLYKQSPLGWIPKEWDAVTLASIADVQTGATPLRAMGCRYFDARGFPWVKTLDLNEDVITDTDERITVAAVKESSCSLLPIGAVLVAMYGGWEQIGRVAMLNIESATNQAISALRFKSQETVPEYVLRAIQHGRPRWKKVAASTRKDPNITKADVEAFQIAMPLHPTEQIEIAARYRALLEQLDAEQASLQKFQSLKAGLMDDLLTGRVRVTPLLAEEEAAHG